MHSLGIVQIKDRLRFALIRDENKQLVIERLGESLSIPDEILSIKNLTIVTGLEGEEVLRRDVTLPLTSERLVQKSLPFQLEPLLPFPLDQSMIFSQYHLKGKETAVTLWATTKDFFQSHLAKWRSLGIDPDRVSYESLALARWMRFFYPHYPQAAIVYENIAIALDHDQVVCAMSSPEAVRLNLFLKQKYPLFEKIVDAPSNNNWTPEKLWHFAIAIGLSLESFEKKPCQLRSNRLSSVRQKKRESHLLKTTFALGLGLLLLTVGLSNIIFYLHERKLSSYIPGSDGTLEENISAMRQKILQEAKTAPSIPNIPTVQETLAWLSAFNTSVDIQHISYELVSYPNQALVTLDFQADSSSTADLFIKQLQQTPSFVESTHELKWTSHPLGYTLSFPLQKSS